MSQNFQAFGAADTPEVPCIVRTALAFRLGQPPPTSEIAPQLTLVPARFWERRIAAKPFKKPLAAL